MPSLPPRIMYKNLLSTGTVTESTHVPPFDATGALSSLTYEYWRFDELEATLDIVLEEQSFINTLCFLGYGIAGATVELFSLQNGGASTKVASKIFIEDGVTMIFLDEPVSAPNFQITFLKAVPSISLIRNIMLGSYLEFEYCLMKTHSPAPFQRQTKFSTNVSGDGQFLGRSISRMGIASNINLELMGADWARNEFQRFVEQSITDAYYLAWNPGLYEQEVIYGWTDQDIKIAYTGDANKMSSSFSFKGFGLDRSKNDIRNARIKESGDIFRITETGFFRNIEKV